MEASVFDRRGARKYLNAKERRAFLRAAQAEPNQGWRAFCLTLFYTGCRISEGLNLIVGRVDFSQKAVVFETLKRRQGGVFRSVPIPDSLAVVLGRISPRNAPQSRVWCMSRPTAYRLVVRTMRRAGIGGGMACPKGLRHSFAVACIGESIPLPTIQKWLGHARIETTSIYLNVSDREERNLARRLWRER